MICRSFKNIIPFLLLSLLIHLFLYGAINSYLKTFKIPLRINKPQRQVKIKVKPIKKLRTVGKKDGKKDIFTDPTIRRKKKLTLDALSSAKSIQKISSKKSEKIEEETQNQKFLRLQKKKQRQQTRIIKQHLLQKQIIKSIGLSHSSKSLLKNKGLNALIETPEGISEDELNKLEMVFYTFYKRVYKNIVSSFIINANDMLKKRPYILKAIESTKHTLNARVRYDHLGNIIAIKIFKSSRNDHVHQLFENVLTKMSTLSNPPKQLINKNKEFSINYQLTIN